MESTPQPTERFVFLGDIFNPETGKTLSEENREIKHAFPLRSLVETGAHDGDSVGTAGMRLWVVSHQRDCDGSPLYGLSFDKFWQPYHDETSPWDMLNRSKCTNGWPEESLTLLETCDWLKLSEQPAPVNQTVQICTSNGYASQGVLHAGSKEEAPQWIWVDDEGTHHVFSDYDLPAYWKLLA